jgi:hypothetical protein
MNASAKSILLQAIQLPAVERAGLVDELFETLHETDASLDALWLQEAESRIAAYRTGELDSTDARNVFSELGKKV